MMPAANAIMVNQAIVHHSSSVLAPIVASEQLCREVTHQWPEDYVT